MEREQKRRKTGPGNDPISDRVQMEYPCLALTMGRGMEKLAELEIRNCLFGLFTEITVMEGKMLIGMKSMKEIPENFYRLKCVERIFLCLYFGPVTQELEHALRTTTMSEIIATDDLRCFVSSLRLNAAFRICRGSPSYLHAPLQVCCQENTWKGITWRIRCRGSWRKCDTSVLAQALHIATAESRSDFFSEDVQHEQLEVVVHVSDTGAFFGLPLTERTLSLRASALRSEVEYNYLQERSRGGVRSTVAYGMCLRSESSAQSAEDFGDARYYRTVGDVILDPVCGKGGILLEAMRAWPAAFILGTDISVAQLAEARLAVGNVTGDATTMCGIVELIACDAAALPLRAGWVTRVLADLPFGRQHACFASRGEGEPRSAHGDRTTPTCTTQARTDCSEGTGKDEAGDGGGMVRAVLGEAWRVTAAGATACLLTVHETEVRAAVAESGEWGVVEIDPVQLGIFQGAAMVTLQRKCAKLVQRAD